MGINQKNIVVFPGWFGLNKKGQLQEKEVCLTLHKLIKEDQIEWDNENYNSFWINEDKVYYKHYCSNGNFFNYPIKIEKFPGENDIIINRAEACFTGKIRGIEQRQFFSGDIDPHYKKMAEEDLKKNPVKEQGFDWKHLKEEVGNDIF